MKKAIFSTNSWCRYALSVANPCYVNVYSGRYGVAYGGIHASRAEALMARGLADCGYRIVIRPKQPAAVRGEVWA
jgi:hypothetical protein